MNAHIIEAVRLLGSQKALADACGVSQAAVSKWVNGGQITAEKALLVQRSTDGAVSAQDLRPDIFSATAA
jgi:DNA-binding transcriptional regulator YdaS (Cro superfamily)